MQYKIFFFLLFLLSKINTKDFECLIEGQKNPTETSMCTSVATGTQNLCCYTTYKNEKKTQVNTCLLADGSTPQTIMDSIINVKNSLKMLNYTDVTMECGTESEICYNIQNPTDFSNCNVTEQEYPFSCCFVKTEKETFCYPIDASLNSTATYFGQLYQTKYNLTNPPYINCSYFNLTASGNYIGFKSFFLLIVLCLLFWKYLLYKNFYKLKILFYKF